jgi:hypothetical protein
MRKITFELEGKEYKLPNILSIGDYVKIFKIKDLFEEDYFQVKILSIITGAPMDKLMKVDREKIEILSSHLLKLIPQEKPLFSDRFELNGVHYGFIPEWKKMSFGEFADLDTLMTKKPDEVLNQLHTITAILYRPITKEKLFHKYEIEEYDFNKLGERAELFKNELDVEYALGSQFFFTLFAKIYSVRTPISLKQWMSLSWNQIKVAWMMRKLIWRIILKRPLGGSSFLTEFHKTILQNTQKFLKKQ